MHPPQFLMAQKLSDWPECRLELHCPCRGVVLYPLRLMAEQSGNRTFDAVLGGLRCGGCGKKPAPVFLCAGGSRTHNGGAPPDWAIELVPAPR